MSALRLAVGALLLATSLAGASPTLAMEDSDLVFTYTRLEVDGGGSDRGRFTGNWVGDGWIGTDTDRFFWKTKGETTGDKLESGDLQLLYSRSIAPYWDLQGGYRREFRPSRADYAVMALHGITPYWFETDFELFFGGPGTVGGRLRVEHDLLWTQRIITRPELTLDWSVGDDRENGQGAGIRRVELEIQTRYEITREFAPYVAARYVRELGATERLTRDEGRDPQSFVLSLGVRLVF